MNGVAMRILVVDDNESLLFALERVLQEGGYECDTAVSIAEAEASLESARYDLILLDWLLPDGSGVAWLHRQRRDGVTTPVLLFSSKNEVEEKVEALDGGADDYLEKPFSNIELLARVRALLRREASRKLSRLELGDVMIDLVARKVFVAGQEKRLSAKEFELLEFLALNANVVLTKYQLLEHLHKEIDRVALSNIIEAHIKNIRKKLGRPELIETVRGVGYVIRTK